MKEKVLLLSFMLMFAISSYGQSGQDGNISWSITDSTLTISGTGDMKNYDYDYSLYDPKIYAPWYAYKNSIKIVVINYGVTSIGFGAFCSCENLSTIKIPNSVTVIGGEAFASCKNLNSINIPSSVLDIGVSAFRSCNSLVSIEIPNSVVNIGESAFAFCHSLVNVKLSDGLTSISKHLFSKCNSLVNIEIPDGVTEIKCYAFSYCSSLKKIRIPNGVISIEEKAFVSCEELQEVNIPSTVRNLENAAFSNCNLIEIKIPDGVTRIENAMFDCCRNLVSVTIPSSVTSIGCNAFQSCESLDSIEIPNSITTIDAYAFANSGLRLVKIPDGVTEIESNSFYFCPNLKNVYIPNGVTIIKNRAFFWNALMSEIKIPRSVTTIEQGAFNCRTLQYVDVYWEEPIYIESTVFTEAFPAWSNVNLAKATLTVPAGTKALYEAAPVWQDFGTIIERAPEVPVTSVSVSPKTASLMAGSSLQLVATISPSNATNKNVTWTSSNDAVATVDATGRVLAVGGGSATITVTTVDGGKVATFNVTVFEIAVTSVTLNTTAESIFIGDTLQLTATVNPSYASNKTITWSSGNNGIATVDAAGRVVGVSEGSAIITATSNNGKTATCLVTVSQQMNYVTIEIPIGDTGEFIVFDVERPAGSDEVNSFVMGFPEGLEIDPESVILTETLSEGLILTVTPLGYNTWLFEVSAPSTFSFYSATKYTSMTTVSCRITGSMGKVYKVVLCDINAVLSSGANIPKYELVPTMRTMAGETGNSQIETEDINAVISNGTLMIETPYNETIKVYSIAGVIVFTAEKEEGKVSYHVSNLPNGIYVITGSNGWSVKALKK